jgi:hypothetical protein
LESCLEKEPLCANGLAMVPIIMDRAPLRARPSRAPEPRHHCPVGRPQSQPFARPSLSHNILRDRRAPDAIFAHRCQPLFGLHALPRWTGDLGCGNGKDAASSKPSGPSA